MLLLLHVLLLPLLLFVQPEGEGRYEWADGSSYEGGWKVRPVLLAGHTRKWIIDGCGRLREPDVHTCCIDTA
jgi:hypothetical protein